MLVCEAWFCVSAIQENEVMVDDREIAQRFPRAQRYPLDWIVRGGMGSNPLWITEWLCQKLELRPGMRVLDLGCGYARSSIFLAKEFGVQVWATDLWVPATENLNAIRKKKLDDRVFPLHADAKSLPFAAEFFDAILAIDCYSYFGTDDLYLNYLIQFLKTGGQLGIAGAGLTNEMSAPVPAHLQAFWTQDLWSLHSTDWWQRHWERTGLVEIESTHTMADGWKLWTQWQRQIAPSNNAEIEAIENDAGRHIGYIRLTARRKPGTELAEYCWPDTLKTVLKDHKIMTDETQPEVS
jgi:cyclopropane fatty-acyl-phospholipid synthase-like methyltransferase